jgi:hypothetical protein
LAAGLVEHVVQKSINNFKGKKKKKKKKKKKGRRRRRERERERDVLGKLKGYVTFILEFLKGAQ